MMMLKKACGEVTEQTIRNCFRKSGNPLDAQEGAMDDHDDSTKRYWVMVRITVL